MENTITKYLIENKEIRMYLLVGKQIYHKVTNMSIDTNRKEPFIQALNIAALANSLDTEKRLSYSFISKNKTSKITTESFSNQTITGLLTFKEDNPCFKGGTLQVIASADSQYSRSHTSYSTIEDGDFYKAIERFYLDSEQTATYLVPLSAKQNSDNIVLLVQPLPFVNEQKVKAVLKQINDIRQELRHLEYSTVEKKLSALWSDRFFLETVSIDYECGCSKEAFLGILFSLAQDEFETIISQNKTLTIPCSLCSEEYTYTAEDIRNYLN
jgi:molecular chaperone Hsp33